MLLLPLKLSSPEGRSQSKNLAVIRFGENRTFTRRATLLSEKTPKNSFQ